MKIYIDESNTTGFKKTYSKDKIISAGYYIEDPSDVKINAYFNLLEEELKGSDLTTRQHNKTIRHIYNLLSTTDYRIGFFCGSERFLIMKDRVFDIFYPYDYRVSNNDVEYIRQKLLALAHIFDWGFLNDQYDIRNKLGEYRTEILNYMESEDRFSWGEISQLKKFFEENKKITNLKSSESTHSGVITDLVSSIFENIKCDKYEFIIDDFTHQDIKNIISSDIKHYAQFFNLKYTIEYQDSKDNIGIQIADIITTTSRKYIEYICKSFDVENISLKTYDIDYLNHIKSLMWIYFNGHSYIQIHPYIRAFLNWMLLMPEGKKIDDRIKNNFKINILKKFNENFFVELKHNTKNKENMIEKWSKHEFDMSTLDLENSEDMKFIEGVILDSFDDL